jgi:hypothetical protein
MTDLAEERNMQVDIEVLKTEVQAVKTAVDSAIAKLDQVLQMQVSITQLQERYEGQRQALDRAFQSIAETKGKTGDIALDLQRSMAFVKGGAFIGALLFAFAQWYASQQIAALQENIKSVVAIDRRLMFIEAKVQPGNTDKKE